MSENSANKINVQKYFSLDCNPYEDEVMGYLPRNVEIRDDSGNLVNRIENAVFPSFWSANAANTVATKYFRREGVPGNGRELDIRQLAGRVAKTIAKWGENQGYFDSETGKILEDELVASTIFQYGAFNSPVWFNLGLDLYGIKEDGRVAAFYVENGEVKEAADFYEHPQVSACFISSPEDSIESMINTGAVNSARIFRAGSGIGGDWSKVRSAGEPISGGGVASGAKRFMDVQDSCARVIKSGGKTRRAATMQSISAWHADMIDIIRDKYAEECKARILIENGSPKHWESHTIQNLRGQNVNISVRTDNAFWQAYETDSDYEIRNVIGNKVLRKEKAKKLAKILATFTHGCGDPGMQYHSTINRWNTCKNSGDIWASNPCSEYMFLDNSACNLVSLNLMRFRKTDGNFDIESFCKAVDLFITSQDILISPASYPTEEIAANSDKFRPLGLGFANLGTYILSLGLPYDSDGARQFASAITSLMTAEAYLQSTRLAEKLGAFKEYEKNKESMLKVIEMHRKSANEIPIKHGLEYLVNTAIERWEEVAERGKKYGFRNAQVTLLAPTGTTGFMMDCDTTGCEPVYALKSYKELAGGGSIKIVNQTVPLALKKLNYNEEQIERIEKYIDENETLEGSEIEKEHLPVFDCAASAGKGTRTISPLGHIKMLGALQPYLSGSISKTVNCPENTSVEGIENMFYQAWKLGIKSIAIFRNNSKAAQPLTTKKSSGLEILVRGKREELPAERIGITQKVKVGDISVFLRTGEYRDGRLGELFIDSLERGSEINRSLNFSAIQFSEKLQYGVPLREALEAFKKVGLSQISGLTNHPFIKTARGVEGFVHDWISAHYLGDISFILTEPEMRPLPYELRAYRLAPKLHLIPSICGEPMYPGAPTLEDTIKKISGTNYWCDSENDLDTRQTLDKIRKTRIWKSEHTIDINAGKLTGKICDKCGNMMIIDGNCWKCPACKILAGGCGGG